MYIGAGIVEALGTSIVLKFAGIVWKIIRCDK
jgi:hypothetical protein